MINQAAARLLWPTRDPLGHRVELGTRFGLGGPRAGGEVVGVVADVRDEALDAPPRPTVYLGHAQFPIGSMSVVVASAGDPLAAIGPARQRLQQLDPELALAGIAGGLALALLLGRTLSGLLYEIRPADPATLAGVALLTGLIALTASLVPARRATRLDPTDALRSQ